MLSAGESDGDLILATWVPDEREPVRLQAQRAWTEIAAVLDANAALPLHERVFGALSAAPCVLSARRAVAQRRCEELRLLPTFIEGRPLDPSWGDLAGIHVVAARSADGGSRWIESGGRVCGRVVDSRTASFLSFSDAGSSTSSDALGIVEDAAAAMDRAERALSGAGWSLADVYRAWFHLSDVAARPDELDAVRHATCDRMAWATAGEEPSIPATTASGGRSAGAGHCALDFIAARPGPDPRSFARHPARDARRPGSAAGVRLDLGESRYVFVSAAASVDASGRLLDAADFRAQALRTLENVVGFLESQGAGLDDVRQATAFLSRDEDVEDFQCLAEVLGLWEIPVIAVRAEIREEGRLIEMDATAAVPAPRRRSSEART